MSGHVIEAPPSLRQSNREVDERIEAVVLRALAKEPDERYGGCQEMATALAVHKDFSSQRETRLTQGFSSNRDTRLTQGIKKLERKWKVLSLIAGLLLVSTLIALSRWMGRETAGEVVYAGTIKYDKYLNTPSLTVQLLVPHIDAAFLDEKPVSISSEGLIQKELPDLPVGESTHQLRLVGQEQTLGLIASLPIHYYPNWKVRQFSSGQSEIDAVAFSPDGTTVLSGSRDTLLKLWDVETGDVVRTLAGHRGWVNAVAFSPDGTTVLSGSSDKTVKLWDVATGKETHTFSGHTSGINGVAFSPDGTTVLSGGKDNRLHLWDVETGRLLQTYTQHEDWIVEVAFSPDGTKILSGSDDKTIKLWDVSTGKAVWTFVGHTDVINTAAFSPDGTTVLSASRDKTLKLWDVATGEEIQTFSGHTQSVKAAAFSPDGALVLSSSRDQTVKLWWIAQAARTELKVQLSRIAQDEMARLGAISPSQAQQEASLVP